LDGSFEREVDFPFTINQVLFTKLWLLTDGIYPELGRFVKTIQEPGNSKAKRYAAWQEGSRKDIERAFGVLQRKFAVLTKPLEYWHLDDINKIVNTTIILHNMMVAHRIDSDEIDSLDFYEVPDIEDERDELADPEMIVAQKLRDEINQLVANEITFSQCNGTNYEDSTHRILLRNANYLSIRLETVERRWGILHDNTQHRVLRAAIMDELSK
jgi:Plant transposon protein